jgi:PAS domain S-box-containing protein
MRRWLPRWLLLPLSLLAVVINLHPPQVFLDQQLMLGSSAAVLALLLFGWPGLAVGVAAYLVTWQAWGHPVALVNGCCWLLALQLYLSRCPAGPAQRSNGRVVLVTVAYWLLIGAPAEWLWFRIGFGITPDQALALALKELVTALLAVSLGLLAYLLLQLLQPRLRRRGLPVRGLVFAVLLLTTAVPGLVICLLLSRQLNTAALIGQRDALASFGQAVAQQGRPVSAPPDLTAAAVRVQLGSQVVVSTDAALFARLDAVYRPTRRPLARVQRLTLLEPDRRQPVLLANQQAYWMVQSPWGDRVITVVQPASALIQALATTALLPSFAVVALLMVVAVLISELLASLVQRQIGRVVAAVQAPVGQASEPPNGQTFIRELNVLARAMRRTTHELATSNLRYLNFFNLPLVGTAITSPSKGWVDVNDVTCQLFGYTREELFQTTWAELTHPDDLAADEALFQRMLSREIDGYQLEKRFIRKDGSTFHALLAGGCGAIGQRQVQLCYVNIIDISARKRVEAELAASQQRERLSEERHRQLLEQKLKTSLTAAAVAHEIQQPLASMLLNCRLAVQSLECQGPELLPAALEQNLRTLTTEGDRVVATMERMRMLLRNVETEQTTVDLVSSLNSALVFLAKDLQQAQVQLSRQGMEQPCLLKGDSAQLQIAVVNLVRNAIQALQAQPPASRRLQLQLQRCSDHLQILVADSGPGFARDYCGSTSWELLKSTKATGMGIGLFLAQTAAANHGGQLRIGRSALLGGAEVVITLPLMDSAGAA